MSYRVECSPNSRAGCQNKPCKDGGVKIEKGEIRFGVYVTIQDHGSFRWKHWGCVSGAQMQGLRDYLEQDDPSTGFKWDFFDGLDELPADQRGRVKKAVIEGKIADEDWKGDPEYNKLGQKGTQPAVRKKNPKFGDEEGALSPSDGKPASKKRAPTKKKATQKTEDGDKDEAETKPAAKKRVSAKKKDIKDEDGEADEDAKQAKPPNKKATAKKVKNEESDDKKETKQVKKGPATRVKKAVDKEKADEEKAGDDAVTQKGAKPSKKAPAKKSAAKKKTKKEVSDEDNSGKDEDEIQAEAKPTPPSRAERASKRAASDPNDENKKPVKKGKTAKASGKQKTGEAK